MSIPELLITTPQWLAVAKPAGWLTIPPSSGRDAGDAERLHAGILVDWVRERHGPAYVLHRIDRETSGVVVFARTPEAQRQGTEWFSRHQVKKAYDCLASGIPSAPVLKLREPIRGSAATTQVEVKESRAEGFLARVVPLTGRRHQIRIHLAGAGHPLWGDVRYGGPARIRLGSRPAEEAPVIAIGRVALHAARVEFPSREVFEAPWPADFRSWVERLREEGSRV